MPLFYIILEDGLKKNLQYNENGWLFNEETLSNEVHELSESDLLHLIELSYEEALRSAQIRTQVEESFRHPERNEDYIIEEMRIWATSGTVITYPFGDIITFDSYRHLYRGENKLYAYSLPTLDRKIKTYGNFDQELICALENLRIIQFEKFLFGKINVVPFWEAMMSEVNYKALAQHYGFATHLLDLTSDFKTALFFATCKFDPKQRAYVPLTEEDINTGNELDQYGMIFHTPAWKIDYMNNLPRNVSLMNETWPIPIDSPALEDVAFQIGYQPFYRCHMQHGYILPMRKESPLQDDLKFEKIRFRQSPAFSQHVFEFMHEGRDVFPYEGISDAFEMLKMMQSSYRFSKDDCMIVYDRDIDKDVFPTYEEFLEALTSKDILGERIFVSEEEVEYPIDDAALQHINSQYNNKNLIDMIGGNLRRKPQHTMRRKEICATIYGEKIAEEWFE